MPFWWLFHSWSWHRLRRRVAYGGAAALTVVVVASPLLVVTPRSAVHAIFLGTGDTSGVGGTILWELHLHGVPLLLLSRIVPIALTAAVALWALRRLGPGALEPAVVVSIIAVALALRLVFEQQLFAYYFMAISIALVLLDVVRGHIRGSLVAWLVVMTTVFLDDIYVPAYAINLVSVVRHRPCAR